MERVDLEQDERAEIKGEDVHQKSHELCGLSCELELQSYHEERNDSHTKPYPPASW